MRTLIEWRAYAWISVGAILGANLRYFLSKIITRFSDAAFPYGTLVINVTGSLLLGFFLIWTTERVFANPLWRWLVAIGFCGSYTTFSGYAFETMAYVEPRNWALFAMNILANNLLCLGAVLVGGMIARGI
ncbi:MAG TPA: fluoride efflux transporter CrcB [Candidatus Angelobacter sp.]|jgi:CrcB protein|nr:fluoride efflux transporter CrcB [Candidatus Angelobacter sp.]